MRFLALCFATTVVAIAAVTAAATRRLPDKPSNSQGHRAANRLPARSDRCCHPLAFPIAFSVN